MADGRLIAAHAGPAASVPDIPSIQYRTRSTIEYVSTGHRIWSRDQHGSLCRTGHRIARLYHDRLSQ
eukprot:3280475-Rhodomonas_salina.7